MDTGGLPLYTTRLYIREPGVGNKTFTPSLCSRKEVSRTTTVLSVLLVTVVAGAGASAAGVGPLSGLTDDLPGVPGEQVDSSTPDRTTESSASTGSDDGESSETAGQSGD